MNPVSCVRCQASVPAPQAEFTADGLVCRTCLVNAAVEPSKVAGLERELSRSTGRKQVIAGTVMLAMGITILALGLSGGTIAILPLGLIAGSLYELAQGIARLSSNS